MLGGRKADGRRLPSVKSESYCQSAMGHISARSLSFLSAPAYLCPSELLYGIENKICLSCVRGARSGSAQAQPDVRNLLKLLLTHLRSWAGGPWWTGRQRSYLVRTTSIQLDPSFLPIFQRLGQVTRGSSVRPSECGKAPPLRRSCIHARRSLIQPRPSGSG